MLVWLIPYLNRHRLPVPSHFLAIAAKNINHRDNPAVTVSTDNE